VWGGGQEVRGVKKVYQRTKYLTKLLPFLGAGAGRRLSSHLDQLGGLDGGLTADAAFWVTGWGGDWSKVRDVGAPEKTKHLGVTRTKKTDKVPKEPVYKKTAAVQKELNHAPGG